MTKNRARVTGRREGGTFAAIPHACLEHKNYARLSPRAVKLLLDLLAQYRGQNNGDLTASWTVMRERGWKSKAQMFKALRELIDTGWIILTRQGGRNACSLFAVTFRPIDHCGGKLIEVTSTATAPGDWKRYCAPPVGHDNPARGAAPPENGASLSQSAPPAVPVRPEIVISVPRRRTPYTSMPRVKAAKRGAI